MDAKLQRRVQRYGWDKAAAHYERSWQAQLEPAQTALLELARIGPGAQVLDVACGTGLVTFRAAALAGPGGGATGTDISEVMVTAARDAARAKEIGNVRFARMGAEELNFETGTFSTVLCALGLMYLPDPPKALREFHRVLRPGGRAAAAVWGRRAGCGWAELFPIVDARVQSEVCPLFFGLGTGDALEQAFAAAGFRDLAAQRLETRMAFATAEEACIAAFEGGPVALAYDRFPEPVRADAREEYLASIEPFREGGGYSMPGEFVVVAGVK